MVHPGEEEFRILVFKRGECLYDSVLGPALRVRLRGVFQKAREGGGQVWREPGQLVVERECGGLGDEVVVAKVESLRELGLGGFGRRVAKGFEGG
jgi:hypothetical protein